MWEQIGLIGLFGLLWTAALWLAAKNGSKAAQLEALKAEIKKRAQEQERANAIDNSVNHLSDDDVRGRLQNIKHH